MRKKIYKNKREELNGNNTKSSDKRERLSECSSEIQGSSRKPERLRSADTRKGEVGNNREELHDSGKSARNGVINGIVVSKFV